MHLEYRYFNGFGTMHETRAGPLIIIKRRGKLMLFTTANKVGIPSGREGISLGFGGQCSTRCAYESHRRSISAAKLTAPQRATSTDETCRKLTCGVILNFYHCAENDAYSPA